MDRTHPWLLWKISALRCERNVLFWVGAPYQLSFQARVVLDQWMRRKRVNRAQEIQSSRFGAGSRHSGCEAMKLLAFIQSAWFLALPFPLSSTTWNESARSIKQRLISNLAVAESVLMAESAASECLSHGTFLSSVEASHFAFLSFSVGGLTRKVRIQLWWTRTLFIGLALSKRGT